MLAVSVKEKSLKSQELECRPRHMSLLLVLRRDGVGMVGRWAFVVDDPTEPWLAEETWRGCLGCWVAYVGLAACVVEVRWKAACSGDAARDRLRERPRIFAPMALKKESSAGLVGEREYMDVGECMTGDAAPEEWEFCEPPVAVRMGGGGWKLAWDGIIAVGLSGTSGCGVFSFCGMPLLKSRRETG